MGLSDFLKKLFPPGESPLLSMDPQCVRYQWLTLRLPAGWRFTQADGRSFSASGPGSCSVAFFFANVVKGAHKSGQRLRAQEFEDERKNLVQLMGKYFLEGKSGGETILPTGIVWMEATDTQGQGKRLRIALLNPRPRNQEWIPPMLQVTCTTPGGSSRESLGADQFEALRAALRGIEWN
ncbi:MAG TPA: hypothetical protein VFO57_13215 [Burkholderiales bacterium]|nr:hypothetical protein [Burkholderiales bacterium]